jgi:hypothetical protein
VYEFLLWFCFPYAGDQIQGIARLLGKHSTTEIYLHPFSNVLTNLFDFVTLLDEKKLLFSFQL